MLIIFQKKYDINVVESHHFFIHVLYPENV